VGGSRQEKAAATQAALKNAAIRVFARHGYLNTKITDITAEAGRSAGSFYNHFEGKEELLESLLADAFAAGDEAHVDHPEQHDLSDPDHMRRHVAGFWGVFGRYRTMFTAVVQAAMVDARFARRLDELMAIQQEPMRQHIDYLAGRGIDLPGPPEQVVEALTGMWFQFAYRVHGRVPDDEAIDTLTAFSLRGLTGHAR
jgi:AcrR family transcriptional regulator